MSIITKKLEELDAHGYIVKFADAMTLDDWNKNMILIGGTRANSVTRRILPEVTDQLRFEVGPDKTSLEHLPRGADGYLSVEWSDQGEMIEDYGAIVFCQNPISMSKWILITAGGNGPATEFCAARSTSQTFRQKPQARKGRPFIETFRIGIDSLQPTLAHGAVISDLNG